MKEIISIQDYRELFGELRQVRNLRLLRKNKIHSNIKRKSGRKRLEELVKKLWKGGYVYLESGDYLYVPSVVEMSHPFRLFDPYVPEQIISKFCNLGSIVMDIGANMGEYSLHMAKMVGGNGRVFSFEPIPSMVQALEKTIAINNFSQVSISECAISNKTGHSQFSIPLNEDNRALSGLSYLVPEDGSNFRESMDNIWCEVTTAKTSEVQTTTLDRFTSEKNITKLDFIKIDVEGHEKYVIEGGQKTLKTLKPAMILEAACEETADREIIADQLRKLNYKLVGIVQQEGIIECSWSQYINMKVPFDPTYPENVLFLPKRTMD